MQPYASLRRIQPDLDRVRLAADGADISHVVRLVIALAEAVKGPQEVDTGHTGVHVARLMQSPAGVVFVSAGGFIAAEVSQTIISPDLIAFEHGWFARDRSGIRLLNAFEQWADSQNCVGRKLSTGPTHSAASKILERRGYKPAELAWFK